MASRRKKHYCAFGNGCAVVLPGKAGEFCEKHTCGAFSVAYGQCIARLGHQNKHIGAEGDEWGGEDG